MARKLTKHARATQHYGDYGEGAMIYRGTAVARWDRDTISLDTGGYRSRTIKERMNQAAEIHGLGFTVYQKGGEWFADYYGLVLKFNGRTLTLKRSMAPVRQS